MSVYATRADLTTLGIPSQALGDVPDAAQDAALSAASATADSYLSSRFTLPLTSWGDDLRQAVCAIAAWTLISGMRGITPNSESSDVVLRDNAREAKQWLSDVAANKATPVVTDSRPKGTATGGLAVFSEPRRGW